MSENITTFFETLKDGTVREVDIMTGEVLRQSQTVEQALNGQLITPPKPTRSLQYSQAYGDLILQKMCEGMTWRQICSMPAMPSYATICRWRAENPEFEDAITMALKMRADRYLDLIVDEAEESKLLAKEEVPAMSLRIKTLQWLAEKHNPDKYGNRTKISGDKDQPLQIVVDTGIVRENPKVEE